MAKDDAKEPRRDVPPPAPRLPTMGGPPLRSIPTHWPMVKRLSSRDAAARAEAWKSFHQTYRPSMVAYVHAFLRRGLGHAPSVELAEEVTQGFVVASLEKRWMERADPEKGLFRGYLHKLLHDHCCAWLDHRNAKRRRPAGGAREVSLDEVGAAGGEPSASDSPESAFDRAWVGVVLSKALEALRAEDEASASALDELLRPEERERALTSTERGRRRTAIERLRPHFARALSETIRSDVFFEEEWSALAAHLPEDLREGPAPK